MHRWTRALFAVVMPAFAAVALLMSVSALPATAQQRIGVVLIHGKLGMALGMTYGRGQAVGANLIAALRNAGYLVVAPEMCWSQRRNYDKTFPDCIAEIDDAIVALKRQGATEIVVAGLSLGGNGAIAYAATHAGIKGVVAYGPADDPTRKVERPEIAASLTRAHQLVAQGQGDTKTTFDDVNTTSGGPFAMTVTTTPRIFLSFNDADALTHIRANVARLGVPILWVAGDRDPTQRAGRLMFGATPANPLNRYVEVHSNHLGTPDAGTEATIAWLGTLNKP